MNRPSTDRDFLIWLHQRLVVVHKESPFFGYMHNLRTIIHDTPKDRQSLSYVCDMRSSVVMDEIRNASDENPDT